MSSRTSAGFHSVQYFSRDRKVFSLPRASSISSVGALTFCSCISKQCLAAFVHFCFTSLIFLLVCASFLCMLSIRLWFLEPLPERKQRISRRRSGIEYRFRKLNGKKRVSRCISDSLNHSREEFDFTLHFFDFQINSVCHCLFAATNLVVELALDEKYRIRRESQPCARANYLH
jgi:hypothetical protein